MTDIDNIIDAAETSYSNVQKAEWTGEATNYFCVLLDCGHRVHCSRDTLRGRMMCMVCLTAKLVKNGTLKTYPGLPHGMTTTHAERVNADLLEFIKADRLELANA